MKCIVRKTQLGFSIEVPQQAQLEEGEAEIFETASGACVIVAQKKKGMQGSGAIAQESGIGLAQDENALLKKLSSIKFEERTPEKVDRKLSQKELAVLAMLMKKKLVNVFYGKKYAKTGVYNIADNAFVKAKSGEKGEKTAAYEKTQMQTGEKARAAENAGSQSLQHLDIPLMAELEKRGFCVCENEQQARLAASLLQQKIAGGEVLGVRGFDRRYYLATRKFYAENSQKIEGMLAKPKSAAEISNEAKLEEDAAIALLHLMCERGEAIEKRKGTFERA